MAGRDAGRYHVAVAAPRGTQGARHVHVYESAMVLRIKDLQLSLVQHFPYGFKNALGIIGLDDEPSGTATLFVVGESV
jgi:hypothetical protein